MPSSPHPVSPLSVKIDGFGNGIKSSTPSPKNESYQSGWGDFKLGQLGDEKRNRVQRLLHEALGQPSSADPVSSSIELAMRIENAMWNQLRTTGKEYIEKYRDISYNLKDPKNPELRRALFEGRMTAEELVNAEPHELASESLKKQRADERQYAKDATRSDWNKKKAMTDMFRCGKCGQRQCTYYQMQTRSADEPMTTFVTCTVCGNKFRC